MSAYLTRLEIANVGNVDEEIQTQYLKRVSIVEVVDQNGQPWEPVPPADPLAVADGQGANWLGTNIYEVGQTVEGKTAAYTGGVEPVTYRYRFQFKATGSDSWVNGSWTNTTNAKNSVTYTLTETGQVKLQSQARDSSDPTEQLNSVTGIKTVAAQRTIGTVSATVDGANYPMDGSSPVQTLNGNTLALATAITGDASPSYSWSVKQGSANLVGNGSSISATIDSAAPASVQIQCDIIDVNASDNPFSFRFFIVVGE